MHNINEDHDVYQASLHRLSHSQGRYVLISQAEIVGVFDTMGGAIEVASRTFGVHRAFLIKRIAEPLAK